MGLMRLLAALTMLQALPAKVIRQALVLTDELCKTAASTAWLAQSTASALVSGRALQRTTLSLMADFQWRTSWSRRRPSKSTFHQWMVALSSRRALRRRMH